MRSDSYFVGYFACRFICLYLDVGVYFATRGPLGLPQHCTPGGRGGRPRTWNAKNKSPGRRSRRRASSRRDERLFCNHRYQIVAGDCCCNVRQPCRHLRRQQGGSLCLWWSLPCSLRKALDQHPSCVVCSAPLSALTCRPMGWG